MTCWCGYLSGARCRLFAHGLADATAIPQHNHLLLHLNPDWFCLLALAYPGCPGRQAVKRVQQQQQYSVLRNGKVLISFICNILTYIFHKNNTAAIYSHIPDEYLNKRVYSPLYLQTGHNISQEMTTADSGKHHLHLQ